MRRLAPLSRTRLDPIDLVVTLALAIVPFAYYLGYGLDWSLESPPAATDPETDAANLGGLSAEAGPLAAGMWSAVGGAVTEAGAGRAALAPAEGTEAETAERIAWDLMTARLEQEAKSYRGRVSIVLKDLKRDRVWTHRADDLFPSASLIKVPIMVAAFDKIHQGELSLQTRLVLRRQHRVGGSGSIKWSRDGAQYTVRQVLEKMIDESDNTAMRMLIEAVGFGYLQHQFGRMGLLYTDIYPEGLSLKGRGVAVENYTTAREMAGLLERIYRGEMVDRYSSELMLDILKRQKSRARLAKGLPRGWEIAHKTGLLRGACHDSAVIFTPQGDYVLTVLTGQNRDYGRAKAFITKLGLITYKYYRSPRSFFARAAPKAARRAAPQAID